MMDMQADHPLLNGAHPPQATTPKRRKRTRGGHQERSGHPKRGHAAHAARNWFQGQGVASPKGHGHDYRTFEEADGTFGWATTEQGDRLVEETKKRLAAPATVEEPAWIDPPRQPTPEDKFRIRKAIENVYDEHARRYVGDGSDAEVAESLDVPVAWVAVIREAYGPDQNDAKEALLHEAEALRAEAASIATMVLKAMERQDELEKRQKALDAKLRGEVG